MRHQFYLDRLVVRPEERRHYDAAFFRWQDLERAAKAVESSDGTHFSGSAVVYTMLATIPDEKEAERFVVQALSDIYTADQTIEE